MKAFLLKTIRAYQRSHFFHTYIFRTLFLSDSVCKFIPPCSEYTYQAIEKYGVLKGLLIGLRRIIRCHPWSKGGIDPVQ